MKNFISLIFSDLSANNHRCGIFGLFSSLLFTPGFLAIFLHRLAVYISSKGMFGRILGKIVWRINVSLFGCYFSLKSKIGPGLRLPHPVAIVVGDGVVLGSNVTLYQGVTIGVRTIERGDYPVVGDCVTIFAGSVVCGAIEVGDGVVVGANSVLLMSVEKGAHVCGSPARVVRCKAI